MASVIATVYDNLNTSTVTVNGVTPTVYNLDELKQSADTANLPMRLLIPTQRRSETPSFTWLTYSAGCAEVEWLVTDLMLWEAVGQTRGLIDVAESLVLYQRQYLNMLMSFTEASGSPIMLVNANTAVDVFAWPDSETFESREFWGVECILTFRELI